MNLHISRELKGKVRSEFKRLSGPHLAGGQARKPVSPSGDGAGSGVGIPRMSVQKLLPGVPQNWL